MQTFTPQRQRVLKVKMENEVIDVRFPKTGELLSYEKDVKALVDSGEELAERTFDFLESLGLKKEIAKEFDHIDLMELLKILRGSQGKK